MATVGFGDQPFGTSPFGVGFDPDVPTVWRTAAGRLLFTDGGTLRGETTQPE
jgi:hypothetical protein